MKIIRDLGSVPPEICAGAVAIGNFDGVHLGHAQIVRRLIELAREVGGPAVVFTFDPHPVRLLRPSEAPPPLTWTERKGELLGELGIDWMIAYPTDDQLLRLSPDEFFQLFVREKLQAKALVEGPNFRFGHDRVGTIDLLARLASTAGISLAIVPACQIDAEPVSSSRVRRLIAAGDVEAARRFLTQPYRLRGLVTHGAGRGARLGFPTANIEGVDTLMPGQGVYAGRGWTGSKAWPAAINIGPNPTFGEHALKLEVHLVGYLGALYGQVLEVDFWKRLRDIQAFPSVDALRAQLARDAEQAREIGLKTPCLRTI